MTLLPPALPLEIAARAAARMEVLDYPDNPKGRERANAYVEDHWRAIWEIMRQESLGRGIPGSIPGGSIIGGCGLEAALPTG